MTAQVQRDGVTETIEGVVTEVKSAFGRVMLELDTGEIVALADVTKQTPVERGQSAVRGDDRPRGLFGIFADWR